MTEIGPDRKPSVEPQGLSVGRRDTAVSTLHQKHYDYPTYSARYGEDA